MSRPVVYALKCPNCGSSLQVKSGAENIVCAHCASSLAVHVEGGAVTLEPIVADIRDIRRSSDKTAAELALKRLSDEIAQLNSARAMVEKNRAAAVQDAATRAQAIRSPGMFVPLFAVAAITLLVTGVLLGLVGSMLPKSDGQSALGHIIGVTLLALPVAAATYVGIVIQRGRRRQIAASQKQCQEQLVALDGEKAELGRQIDDRETKSLRHREVAET